MTIDDSTIEELATSPKKTQTAEGSVEERNINETIAGDRYARARQSSDAAPWGIRMARVKPGSTTPGSK